MEEEAAPGTLETVTGTLCPWRAVLGAEQGQDPDQGARSKQDVGAEAAGARTASEAPGGS